MLKIANGRLEPETGEVLYGDKPLRQFSRREIGQTISFVPQSERIAFEYTVLEYVCMGRTPWLGPLEQPSDRDLEISAEALRNVGMDGYIDHIVTRLSGGQQQLVLLARALTQETQVLLLDEASSQLDLANKRRFLDIIKRLASEGKSIILSTHEPDVAAAIAEKAVLMKNGHVAVAGPMSQVFTRDILRDVYETPIDLVEINGRKVVLWTP